MAVSKPPGDGPEHASRPAAPRRFECPVCASAHYEPLVVQRRDGSTSALSFYRCRNCGYAFTDPALHLR